MAVCKTCGCCCDQDELWDDGRCLGCHADAGTAFYTLPADEYSPPLARARGEGRKMTGREARQHRRYMRSAAGEGIMPRD